MAPTLLSSLLLRSMRSISSPSSLLRPSTIITSTSRFTPIFRTPSPTAAIAAFGRQFSSTPTAQATYNQVRRGCRVEQPARKRRSPALHNRPEMKGVCLKTGITKPKKPNSGERKTARVRLSNGRVVTAYIPGEGNKRNLSYPFFFCLIDVV